MNTKKQEQLIDAFLSELDAEAEAPLYRDIAGFLSELGYGPRREKSSVSFKHPLHNKQIAKMGMRAGKEKGASPFFSLRFSACRGYSQRFADIVRENILKSPAKTPRCTMGACGFCKGGADTHVYTYTFASGESKSHCGAYALEIPGIRSGDIGEIKRLIQEEHAYLMAQEVEHGDSL